MNGSLTAGAIGLQIDDGEMRVAVASPDGDRYAIHVGRESWPKGDGPSDELDAQGLAELLRRLLGRMPVKPIRTGLVLGSGQTVLRVEPVADVQDASVASTCEQRMRRYLLFRGQPICFGYIVQVSSQDGDYPARLLAAATDQSALSQREQVADRGGLIVTRAEPALMTVARMVLASDWVDRPRILLLVQGDACEVAILRQDGLIFCHRLTVAELSNGNGKGLVPTVEGLREFYLRQTQGEVALDDIVCMGALDHLEELLAPLRDQGFRIGLLDPAQWSQVSTVEGLQDDGAQDYASFSPVVAAALTELVGTRSLAELNLLPPVAAPTGFRLTSPWVLAPLALIVLSSVGLNIWDWHARGEATRLLRAVKNPTADMLECSKLLRTESQLKARVNHGQRLLRFVKDANTHAFVDDLGRRLPTGLWLDRLAADTRETVMVEGLAQTEDALYSLIDSLQHSPYVDDVQMSSTSATRLGQHVVNWFRIKVVLAVADSPPAEGGEA